jgi:hypothetical protein
MLREAFLAHIPMVNVATDDVVNFADVLQSIAKPLGKATIQVKGQWSMVGNKAGVVIPGIYWTMDEKDITLENYQRLAKSQSTLVIANAKPNNLLFEAGPLPVPQELLEENLSFLQGDKEEIFKTLKGLSIKTAKEVVMLTIAREHTYKPAALRKTRRMIAPSVQGLIPLESESNEFYLWPPKLKEWLDVNREFFESDNVPKKLQPRGVMLEGPAGTGKTMAAREIAHVLGVPLYRLDISQALDRYIGVAENRVARSLSLAEQESPCVLLIDEAEKVFTHSDDSGTVTRILSTLLWWLNEHNGKVITVMTTNNLSKIPPELYRPGRLDMVLTLPPLSFKDAKQFALDVYKDVTGLQVTMGVQAKLFEAIEATAKNEIAHSEVSELVYDTIKKHHLLGVTG